MTLSRCNRNYHRMKILDRGVFASGVLEAYYKNNPPFTAPVIPEADFKNLLKNYHSTYSDYANGGKLNKGEWLQTQKALIKGLDDIADDVDEVAKGDENVVEKGGFKSIKTFRSDKAEPATPVVEWIDRGVDGQILTRCNMLGLEVYYGCLLTEGEPLPQGMQMTNGCMKILQGLTFAIYLEENKSRKKSFTHLKSGTRYYAYFFARNSAGVSPLSEPRSIICG
jgi:hypothetical protein